MNFVKMHGAGNDFIILEAPSWTDAAECQKKAVIMCDRHFGIGADGLILTGRDEELDIFMRIFNPDGSEPEMCGNGIRCAARYAYENGLTSKTSMSVRTKAGPRYPEIILQGEKVQAVKVDMGEPILERSLIPVRGEGSSLGIYIETREQKYQAAAVSMGNPHCVIFVDDIEQVPVEKWGPELEIHELFPARTNVEFVQVINSREMIMRVWERGAGITRACGTGACAALVAAVLNRKSANEAVVHLLGGDLSIAWNQDDNHVYMTGPAVEVFRGNIYI